MSATALDAALAAMEAAPGVATARLRFWDRLADADLVLLLDAPSEGGRLSPRTFPLDEGPVVLAFEGEARLAAFAGPASVAALSGRALAGLLSGQGLGIGLNFGAEPSILLPARDVDWFAAMLAGRPDAAEIRPEAIGAPLEVPDAILEAIDAKLPAMAGLARLAYLAALEGAGAALVFVDAAPGAEAALSRAIGEAVVFSGLDDGAAAMSVGFAAGGSALEERLARVGLRIDLPAPRSAGAVRAIRAIPGGDPDRPPRLR